MLRRSNMRPHLVDLLTELRTLAREDAATIPLDQSPHQCSRAQGAGMALDDLLRLIA